MALGLDGEDRGCEGEKSGQCWYVFLHLLGKVTIECGSTAMAKVAAAKLKSGAGDRAEFYESKVLTARFFFARMLPDAEARFRMVMAGADSLMAMDAAAF